jgi:PAS domain S-box-containing protein
MKQGNYKAYNVIQYIRYWQDQGVDPGFLFTDTGIDYKALKETDWLDFETQVFKVWQNLFKRVPDHEDFFPIGYATYKNRSMGALDTIARLTSLEYVFRNFPKLANRYSSVEQIEIHRLTGASVVVLYWPAPEFVSLHSLYQQSFFQGLLCGVPKIYEKFNRPEESSIPDARVAVEMSCVEMHTAFSMNYKHLIPNAHCEYTGDEFLVDGKPVARKIILSVEEDKDSIGNVSPTGKNHSHIYCFKEGARLVNLPNQLGREGFAYRILEDFWVEGRQILTKGQIFNAPYTRFNVSWQKVSFLKRIGYFLTERPKILRSSREQLLAQLEVADQRYAAEMKARKRAEEKEQETRRIKEDLEKSETQYRLLAENANDVIWTTDMNLKFTYISPAVEKMRGYSAHEAMAQSMDQVLTPASLEKAVEAYARVLGGKRAGGERSVSTVTMELEHYHKKGGTIWNEVTMSQIRDEKGQPSQILGISRDITDRKRVEQESQALQVRLQRAEKMEALGQLAGGVAHDLNNVLGVTAGYSELLQERIPQESPLREYADTILLSTQKGAAIIADLLTLARRGVVVAEAMNLNSVVSGFLQTPVFEMIKQTNSGVLFRVELGRELLNIKGSAVHVEKTLMNLVMNAVDATSGDGVVTIRTENRYLDKPVHGYDVVLEGDYAALTVSDTGIGIPSEHMGKIFEPFYTKKAMGRSGTGLGLAIVWGTVRDHQGYVDVLSEEGKGATFTLYFPATRDTIAEERGKIPIEHYLGRGESVLVVDDVPQQRRLADVMLKRLGYQVHTLPGGEAAVEYLKHNKADILVLDMIMDPGIDGLETYQEVLKINPKQKAILVSGFSETDRVRETQRLGAGAYVKKPYVMERIGLALRRELEKDDHLFGLDLA